MANGTTDAGIPRSSISLAGIVWLMIPNPFRRNTIDTSTRAQIRKYRL
jgi:hypothetical protein